MTNDPNLDRPYSAMLPRMAFDMSPGGLFTYDNTRKITSLQKNVKIYFANNNNLLIQYTGTPYDIHLNLYLYAKNVSDVSDIIEQILPFFTPDYTVQVELIPGMGDTRAIPIIFQRVSYDDLYDGKFEQRRVLTYTLEFVMKAWFMGPVFC